MPAQKLLFHYESELRFGTFTSMNALYYPFHLCHGRTLSRLLEDYHTVYFRDFMALQLTPLMGTTAFPDRMGDYHPEALKAGRIIQGYNLSGPMTPETILLINRDLADPIWRHLFHEALTTNHRFQRGLFGGSPDTSIQTNQGDSPWDLLPDQTWIKTSFEVAQVRSLSRRRLQEEDAIRFEYGWALIKTSASLVYTIHLCQEHHLSAVTDSKAHFGLFFRTCERDQVGIENRCIKREGY